MFEMAVWWEKCKNDRTAFSSKLPYTQGCFPEVYVWKRRQLFTPHSLMSCLFSLLIVLSFLQSILHFSVWFIHQTFNQMWSLLNNSSGCGALYTSILKTWFCYRSENTPYRIQHTSLQSKESIVSFKSQFKQCMFLRNNFLSSPCFRIVQLTGQRFSFAFIKQTFWP